jgi:hypothetical protein
MKLTGQICFIFLSFVLVSCSATKQLYIDKSADFTTYKTFDFYPATFDNQTDLQPKEENVKRLISSIKKELTSRGLVKADNPDLKVNIGVVVEEMITTRETSVSDAPVYIGQRNYSWKSEEVVVNRQDVGAVTLDIVDVSMDKMIWQASAKKVIVDNQEKMEKRIDDAVNELFELFPIK